METLTHDELMKRRCDWKPEAFDAFWAAYPNKDRKVMAMINWDRMKLSDSDISEMMDYLKECKSSPAWTTYPSDIGFASVFLYYQNWVR